MLLMEKYRIKEEEAGALADFLMPMLEWYPDRRATARQMLAHPWLTMSPCYDYKMSEKEHRNLCLKKKMEEKVEAEEGAELLDSDRDLLAADVEDNTDAGPDAEALPDHDADPESDHKPPREDSVESADLDPVAKKYSLHSELLNVDHGPNPQFNAFKHPPHPE